EAAVGQLPIQNRFDSFIDQRARGRIPDAVLRRVTPQFEQDEIRFKSGIRSQVSEPGAVRILAGEQVLRSPAHGFARGIQQRFADLQAWHHTRAIVCNCTGRLKRTSSSLISISSRSRYPRSFSESISPSTRFSGAEAPAVTATV